MEVTFRNRKLQRTFNSDKALRQAYGDSVARRIQTRLAVLKNAANLARVPTNPPERRHALIGNRKGQYAVNLDNRNRMVFIPNHDPVPLKEDGGVDLESVTSITILEVVDYH